MLSYTTSELGKGWVYGLNTALDQTGATIGPLLIAFVLIRKGDFRTGYALLLISAVLALVTLTVARFFFPRPSRLEEVPAAKLQGFTNSYWLYMLAGAFVAAGLISFELISYHFSQTAVVTEHWIPIFFALAMGTNAISSLIFGRLFDRIGIAIVLIAFLISSLFAPLVFLGNFFVALIGMILWGIGFGAQDTLLKALIAGVMPKGRRNFAFGLFYTGYGMGWLLGSVTTGFLYERSLPFMIGFSVVMQLLSLPVFMIAARKQS
jgi:MFS family permease